MLKNLDIKHLFQLTKDYIQTLEPDVKMKVGCSLMHGEIGIYTDRQHGFPLRISDGEPWTFHGSYEQDGVTTAEEYVKYVVDAVVNQARLNERQQLPERKRILEGYDEVWLKENGYNLTKDEYVDHIRYLISTNQSCPKCKVGIIDVSVGSYYEFHSCHSCSYSHRVE